MPLRAVVVQQGQAFETGSSWCVGTSKNTDDGLIVLLAQGTSDQAIHEQVFCNGLDLAKNEDVGYEISYLVTKEDIASRQPAREKWKLAPWDMYPPSCASVY